MSMQPFSVLYEQIRLHAKRVSVPAMEIAVRHAAREVCYRTTTRRDSIPINIVAGVPGYDLVSSAAQEEVIDIEAAQYNAPGLSVPLVATSPEFVDDSGAGASYPCFFYLDDPTHIVIGPLRSITQNITGGLFVRVILQPTLTATQLDSSLLARCDRAIVHGALAWLLSQNSEPWTNLQLAAAFRRQFETGIAKAKSNVELGFQKTNLQTDLYRF